MSIPVLLLLIIAAIAISIFANVKFKINIGLTGFAFVFIIGVIILQLPLKTVTSYFPSQIFIQMVLVPAFFSIPIKNKTLPLVADKMLYSMRKVPVLVPFVFLAIGMILGFLGGSAPVNNMVLDIIVFNVGLAMGMSPWLCIVTICFGANLGTFAPWASYGNIVSKTTENWLPGMGNEVAWKMVLAWGIFTMILFMALWILTKGYRVKAVEMEKPAPFNPEQKKMLALICIFVLFLVCPSILKMFFPGVPFFATLANCCDVTILASIGIIVCLLMKLGDQKEIMKSGIPWDTALMVAGICTLLNLATAQGVTDYLGSLLSENVSPAMMPVLLSLLGSALSCFAGAIITVYPLLGAIAVPYAAAAGISPVPLLLSIMVGASGTAISPLSSGGGPL